ncbi:hypothetical protein [Pseudomonas chlororaphis]|uniref:hypothetical protein n=1 Tax=Pseudomonas chlororaphis TaxID=587753 RepID=UPI0012DA56DA|nr:hypothetical protein [Pseudomonas chlororaphis]
MAYLLSDAQKTHRYPANTLPCGSGGQAFGLCAAKRLSISAQTVCSFGGGDGVLIVLTKRAQRSHHWLKRQQPLTPLQMMQHNAWSYRQLTSSVIAPPERTPTLGAGVRLLDSPCALSTADVLRPFVGQESGRRAPFAARFLFASPVAGDQRNDVFT